MRKREPIGYLLKNVSSRINTTLFYGRLFRKLRRASSAPIVISIASVLSLLHPYSAFADDQPQLCKQDGLKTWYFAVGHTVFEIKNPDYSKGAPLIGDIDPKYALTSPNPKAPVGCKDNPQQLLTYADLNWPRLEPNGYSGDIPLVAGLIELVRYPFSDIVTPNIDPAIGFIGDEAANCQNKILINRLPNGTFICSSGPGPLNPTATKPNQYNISWEMIISGNRYLTPMGQELAIDGGEGRVSAKYLLTPDTILVYSWDLPNVPVDVTEAQLINVDKLIQKDLLAYSVSNYHWPSS